jgi:hypothetical protein
VEQEQHRPGERRPDQEGEPSSRRPGSVHEVSFWSQVVERPYTSRAIPAHEHVVMRLESVVQAAAGCAAEPARRIE